MLEKSPIVFISESKTNYAYLLKLETGETFTILPTPKNKEHHPAWLEGLNTSLRDYLGVTEAAKVDLRNLRELNKVRRLENLFNPPAEIAAFKYQK